MYLRYQNVVNGKGGGQFLKHLYAIVAEVHEMNVTLGIDECVAGAIEFAGGFFARSAHHPHEFASVVEYLQMKFLVSIFFVF